MSINSFQFKLKKVSASEQRVLSALFDFLPKTGLRDKFDLAIREALSKQLGLETEYFLEAVNQGTFGSFLERMPEPMLAVVLGMAPREGKIVIDVDEHLGALFIDKLLGGTAEAVPSPKPLSDTEQGVLQYLILQVMAHLYRLCGADSRLHFRFERFAFTPAALKNIIQFEDRVLALTVRIRVGKHDGYVKLFFPSPLIEQQYLNIEMKGEARTAERAYMMVRLDEFGHVTVPLWAEAGHATVTAGDLKNLEVGDVILFDSTELSLTESGPAGRVILRTGEGKHGGFVTELSVTPKKVQCRIIDVYKGEDIL